MEVVGSDKNKVIWELVGDHVAEEGNGHADIGL